jgi:hypothetical protein
MRIGLVSRRKRDIDPLEGIEKNCGCLLYREIGGYPGCDDAVRRKNNIALTAAFQKSTAQKPYEAFGAALLDFPHKTFVETFP